MSQLTWSELEPVVIPPKRLRPRRIPRTPLVSVRALLLLLILLPPALLLWLIARYGVNLPFGDDWGTPGALLIAMHQHTATWKLWISQHNDSRPLFPRLVFWALTWPGDWDVRREMFASFVVACGTALGAFLLGRKTIGAGVLNLLLTFLASLLIFAPVQSDNWLWGVQLVVIAPGCCLIAMLVICARPLSWLRLALCVVLALIATFSYANGMIVWLLMLPPLWIATRERRMRWGYVCGWVIVAALTIGFYFTNYHAPTATAIGKVSLVERICNYFVYLGNGLGHQLNHATTWSCVIGVVLLTIYLWAAAYTCKFRRNRELVARTIGWFALGAYAIGSGLLIVSGRSDFGREYFLNSKYTSFSLFLPVAEVFLLAIIFQHGLATKRVSLGAVRALAGSMIIALLTLHVITSIRQVSYCEVYRAYRIDTLAMVQLAPFEQREDPFARIYPDPVVVRNEWQQLSTFGLIKSSRMLSGSGDVREFAHESLPGQTGCFEVLQKTAAGDVLASGWSVLPGQSKAPDAVILTYDLPGSASVARGFAVATRTIDRKDVVRILPKIPVHCGWYVLLHTDQIPADAMVISAWAVDLQNARTYPLAGTHLVVR